MSIRFVKKADAVESTAGRTGLTAPYFDLDSSIRVADMVYSRGGGACTADQLAAWLEYKSVRSGTYLTRVSAANKHFGLVDQDGDRFIVTERGKAILAPIMPTDAINARVDAFLSCTLFGKAYEHFKGGQLPPEVGLKNLFQNQFHIVADRVPQAVRVFLQSAEQAGFFMATGDRSRLIKPSSSSAVVAVPKDDTPPPPPAQERPKGGGGGDGPIGGVDSAIAGLLRKLPPPGPWDGREKKRFKDAFLHTIDFLYPDEEEGQS